ncbi:PE domain-containing protein [Actinomycetospora callitridis]|uniref:PE domain-containing protein n=1 Tax=Actinomycetospora callitridis TaxID=913944 RepID=UPI0023655488|nr:PE domain-containing protein [Actinomycetospora callitridis]MDD7919958.1 PE domain-containing protein [Actinomycetospora callitridis]
MTQAGGGSFAVDIARAPKAIRDLEQARDELKGIKRDAIALGQVDPPTRDQVSLDAAQKLSEVGVGSAGSLMQALDGGIAEIERLIGALRTGFAAYERENSAAAGNLRSLQ